MPLPTMSASRGHVSASREHRAQTISRRAARVAGIEVCPARRRKRAVEEVHDLALGQVFHRSNFFRFARA
jgi:hypothetical protein